MGAIAISLAIAATLGEYAPAAYLGLPGTEGKSARIHPTTIHTSY